MGGSWQNYSQHEGVFGVVNKNPAARLSIVTYKPEPANETEPLELAKPA